MVQVHIKKIDNQFAVQVPYESKDILKENIPFYQWEKELRRWLVPATMETLSTLSKHFQIRYDESVTNHLTLLDQEEQNINFIYKIRNDPSWRLNGRLSYLFRHQCVALEAAKKFNSYALFLDTGTGKTATAIEIIRHYDVKTLVVCPLSIIESAWLEDIQKFTRGKLKAVSLWAKKKEERLLNLNLKKNYQVFIINFEGFRLLKKELAKAGFEMLIVDESSKMKDPKSQTTKALIDFGKNIKYRYILSGSPAPNTPLEYWGQMALIDVNLLGNNFYRFRGKWFYPSDWTGYKWDIAEPDKKQLMKIISRKALFFSKDECLDLPEKTFQKRIINMTDQQWAAYRQMEDDLILELQNMTISAANQLSKIMKLRQITSGFAYHESGPIKISDVKFNELENVLSEIGNKQVIIWIQFHFEGQELMDRLGDKACALWGSSSQEEKQQAIRDFQEGKKQYLVANPATAAHGLTFVNCQYAVYFSLSYSHELWKQSQDRIHRYGQKNKVTYIYLLAQETIDDKIYSCLLGKKKISDECLSWLNRKV